ncbi:hypothetical protein EUGRSUZ_D01784 [Eucalyptus grandis]|uniref:Uncharacterized protein n=1 Tax=Eucalyptus grandis TaxID=71139 RepID=A0A059CGV9_EUCGR|nr:hypothetical protein EUGRSUZ_D01784 [Eucalyptus grandis]
MGFLIGQTFSGLIQGRLSRDLILQKQLLLLPWARAPKSRPLLDALCENNQNKFPRYWYKLVGTAEGDGVPIVGGMLIVLINFRKEILPFILEKKTKSDLPEKVTECSDVLVVSELMAVAAHNEDANVALVGHTYGLKFPGTLSNGLCFISYTYAGGLPSCAYGFNNRICYFLIFYFSINKFCSAEASVGHSYNLINLNARRNRNIETTSRTQLSVNEVDEMPFSHANVYLHLQVKQVEDENLISRQKSSAVLPKNSKQDFLSLLGDTDDEKYSIYISGPTLYRQCTALVDRDEQTLSIIKGNPKKGEVSHIFSLSLPDLKKLC